MPRTLLKVFGGGWVGGGLESEFNVQLWSEASALVWTKLNNTVFYRVPLKNFLYFQILNGDKNLNDL